MENSLLLVIVALTVGVILLGYIGTEVANRKDEQNCCRRHEPARE